MRRRRGALPAAIVVLGLCATGLWPTPGARATEPSPEQPLAFSDLHGWPQDDQREALTVFRRSCATMTTGALAQACSQAAALGDTGPAAARRFFEAAFDPVEIAGADRAGFLTAYYEPEFAASLVPTRELTAPLLTLTESPGSGPLPDRAAIESGALAQWTWPIAFLDPVDAFMVHVQGSARLRLPEGGVLRVAYAGRNGQPYTSVARVLAERLDVAPAAMDANRTVAWLKANPLDAPALMRANRSYIFFEPAPALAEREGPIGAAGVPLTAGRSVAIDHAAWSYGLPIWLEGTLPQQDGGSVPLARLTVAQDTGAAIRGAARADLFLGTGPAAGGQAGIVRERVRFVVLRPKVVSAGPLP